MPGYSSHGDGLRAAFVGKIVGQRVSAWREEDGKLSLAVQSPDGKDILCISMADDSPDSLRKAADALRATRDSIIRNRMDDLCQATSTTSSTRS